MRSTCDLCGNATDDVGVCVSCGHHTPLTAAERIRLLTSRFEERDADLVGGDPLRFEGYANAVYAARVETGLAEAAVWGHATIDGTDAVLIVLDFRFLGGSMGVAVGEKVARAYDGARASRLPVVAVTASGGARMQEGIIALAQMAKVTQARGAHRREGLPQVTVLTSPTTGGVFATFASLGDAILCEPGAHVGFAGPRVAQLQTGETPPHETYTPELHLIRGSIDAIVTRSDLASGVGRYLRRLTATRCEPRPAPLRVFAAPTGPPPDAWERLRMARDASRPKAPAILDALLDDAADLRGDRAGADDPTVVVRLGALRTTGAAVMALGQDASAGRLQPSGFRKAVRALELAGRLQLPVVTLVDSPGADPGTSSEAGGVAGAIAQAFEGMLSCRTPTLCVVCGEGGSGGAFALAPADRVLMWEHAVFSVISPEGAASILHRTPGRAAEMAGALRITAGDLSDLGLVDAVVPEPAGGAQADPGVALAVLCAEVGRHVDALIAEPAASRIARRRRRWRRAGNDFLRLA